MQSPTADTLRVFLHVIAATIWVGGQLTLAGLLPALRELGGDAPKKVARQFNRIAWPAFGVLVLTGGWNMSAVDFSERPNKYQVTMFVKFCFVAASGIGAYLHTQAKDRRSLALWGAVGGVSTIVVLFLAILLETGNI